MKELSTNVLLFDAISFQNIILCYSSVSSVKIEILHQKEKQYSVKLHDLFFRILCRMDIYFKRLVIY